MSETGLAHNTLGDKPSSQLNLATSCFGLFRAEFFALLKYILCAAVSTEIIRVRISLLAQPGQLLLPLYGLVMYVVYHVSISSIPL
jgi:hypothetical protein